MFNEIDDLTSCEAVLLLTLLFSPHEFQLIIEVSFSFLSSVSISGVTLVVLELPRNVEKKSSLGACITLVVIPLAKYFSDGK